jgi:outer membrane protein OmpA-like peptidoglycan-associated protein
VRSLILIVITINLFGQTAKLDTVFCDCELARVITLNGNKRVGPTLPPIGPGQKNEISFSKNGSKYVFEKEHHSAWYKLKINYTGSLIFDITPNQTDDDYDFVLFKAGNGNFCDSLSNYKIAPIRSCISRDKGGVQSQTGLSNQADELYIHEGLGDQYARSIWVEKGQTYYLVLDNVYKNGDGHVIQFYNEELIELSGVVTDDENKPVDANITLVDQKGDTVLTRQTAKDGSYKFNAPLRKNFEYTINFYNDRNFSLSKNLSLKDTTETKQLSIVLPKLKKGAKNSVGTINFIPGQTMYLQRSVPAVMNLYKLLERNQKLKIRLIGHSNGRDMLGEVGIIKFTKERALSIQSFLIKKGIDVSRIEIDGKGDHEMLFPINGTLKQQEMNRRVEVLVLEY